MSDQRLSAIRAAAAGHALVLDDLAIKVVLGLDNAAKEHPAFEASTWTLQASVVSLYGVVMILSGWVCVGCARLWCVHWGPFPLGRVPGCCCTCGAISLSDACIVQYRLDFVYISSKII